MGKYRIIKTEIGGSVNYRIQKKWLFWWFTATTRSFITLKGAIGYSDALLTNEIFIFKTEELCREHLEKYYLKPFSLNYKGNLIERRFHEFKDYYVNLSNKTGKYADRVSYEYSKDLNYLKEKIDKRTENVKQTILNA